MELTPRTYPQVTEKSGPLRIGIVGCGSRGLTVLERLCALAGDAGRVVEINVFDPQRPGPGLHSVEQPAYLMLNTVASQISMFPDQAALGGNSGRAGPDFHEWCLRFKSHERVVQPNEFLPRKWLGEYLAWTYETVVKALPANVTVIHHPYVVDNVDHTDMGSFILSTETDKRHSVDWLLLTLGHAEGTQVVDNKRHTAVFAAYPQPHSLKGISATDNVGVEGLGLSAMDVVAGLTVGRGGHFLPSASGSKGLSYAASGLEPKLFMYSRSGLPYRTRPDIKPHRLGDSPLVFTLAAVRDLRLSYPQGIDFVDHVLPLIKAEMHVEYFGMHAALQGQSSLRIKSELANAFLRGDIDVKSQELVRQLGVPPLNESLWNPLSLKIPVDNYQAWVRAFLQEDIQESVDDLDHSPIKAAIEVWRSCREQLRRVVDNHGLTPASHRLFFDQYAPLVNRLVAGPQKERHQELLALADAGVLQWVHSSQVISDEQDGTMSVVDQQGQMVNLDAVIRAHISSSDQPVAQPTIIRQLRNLGVIHGLTEGDNGVWVDAQGKAQPNLWITGPIVEGATYYNHYVPSSGSYSRAFVDADRIAREMLGLNAFSAV